MHSIAFVLLPTDVRDIRKTTESLLAPYDTELEVQPYKSYFPDSVRNYWAEKLGTEDLQTIANRLRLEANGKWETLIDDVGIYEISTHNPRGRFDYWRAAQLFEPKLAVPQVGEDLSRSLCLVSQLPRGENIPYSLITPEGDWFCANDFGVKPIYDFKGQSHLNREANARWEDEVHKLLARYANHLVFALDVHS
jgi:hypothetical protein